MSVEAHEDQQFVDCPICSGHGELVLTNGDPQDELSVSCGGCCGSGRVHGWEVRSIARQERSIARQAMGSRIGKRFQPSWRVSFPEASNG